MIDRTHTGYRCHTRFLVRTAKGDLPRGSHGTVVYELENLGRVLILRDRGTDRTLVRTTTNPNRGTWCIS